MEAVSKTVFRRVVSFTRDVKDKPTVNFHFLVVFLAFELETVGILSGPHHLGTVERGRIRVPRQNLFAYAEGGQRSPNPRDGDQRNGIGFVDSALLAVLVWLRVLDIIP